MSDEKARSNEHIKPGQMKQYVHNELSELQRERLEEHLAVCDTCLSMLAVDTQNISAVWQGDEWAAMTRIEDNMLKQLQSELERPAASAEYKTTVMNSRDASLSKRKERRGSSFWLQRPSVQYGLAAAITILLIGTGSFNAFAERMASIDQLDHPKGAIVHDHQQEGPSWSEQMLGRTSTWLDHLQSKRFD